MRQTEIEAHSDSNGAWPITSVHSDSRIKALAESTLANFFNAMPRESDSFP